MIFISIISSFLNFIIMNIPSNISLNDIFNMNEIDRDINEEYVNFKLKLEISKMVTVDKIFTKKWLFVVDEVLFLRTMKSIKEKKLKYHGFHTINDTEKIQIKKWMMKYMTTYVNPTNHPLINNEEIVNKFIDMINNKDNYVNYDKTNISVKVNRMFLFYK